MDDLRSQVAGEPVVARLATLDRDGRPHLVPIVFALLGDTLYTASTMAKRLRTLRRMENAREQPDVTVIVDRYEDDWTRLWWVRLRGRARVLEAATRPSRPARARLVQAIPREPAGAPRARGRRRRLALLERDLGGVGGISLVVGVRWSFRDKDAEGVRSPGVTGATRGRRSRGGQRGPLFRQSLPGLDGLALGASGRASGRLDLAVSRRR